MKKDGILFSKWMFVIFNERNKKTPAFSVGSYQGNKSALELCKDFYDITRCWTDFSKTFVVKHTTNNCVQLYRK